MPQIVQKLGKTIFEELCLPARRGKTSSTRGSRAGREHGDFNSNMNHAENKQKRIAQKIFPAQRGKFEFRQFSLGVGPC